MPTAQSESHPSISVPGQHTPIAPWRWGIIWLLFLATTLNYMDRQTLQSTSSFIMKDLNLTEEGYGWIEFWFSISYGIFQFPAGLLADRWNLRRLYVASLLIWSAAGFMIGMSHTVLMMSACRFILGIGEAFNWPCAATVVRRLMPLEARGSANGIFHSGASMGAIVTPLLVLAIVDKEGRNWRLVFQVVGALGLVWAAMWYWSLRGARAKEVIHPFLEEAELSQSPRPQQDSDKIRRLPTTIRSESPGDGRKTAEITGQAPFDMPPTTQPFPSDTDIRFKGLLHEFRSFVGLMNLRIFWITFVVSMAINLCWHFYRIWLPRFLVKDLHFDDETMQWCLTAFFMGAGLGSMAAGSMTGRLARSGFSLERSRKIVLMAASLLCLLSTPAVFVSNPWISVTLLVVVGAGSLGCFPIYLAMSQEISGRHTAVCIGFFGTTGWIAIAASAPFIGALVDTIGTFGPCLIAVGFVPLFGAIFALGWPEPFEAVEP